ncbi:MAG: ABC transporter ATP-binding protein [Armatimonadota bacterium]|nr:ABC transporter ATP-binding protein [Armatimonadota bacterium]MDR7426468.1 ABC transporter ATP-binding protein [Armatimonadota bacterium]MDR7463365.1 ABC transporter ATP-binding protein [Armatimonadota bacterium]MDR7468580.1 ABC transporter ATP-binding protein [Armatimonadota bacterium]MDR7475173.1 ABC transporter ATP-binding protein [Armatimonadota bacterium]
MQAIETRDLEKAFGPVRALRQVTLDVPAGESLVIFGPNGAGKTTLIKILATLMRPSAGTLRLFGRNPQGDDSLRRLIGLVSHHSYLYTGLTALENLVFTARMYGVPDAAARAAAMLETVGLGSRRYDLVRTFSRGMLQRLTIARALVHDPPLLLLDEPYTGLDRHAAEIFSGLLERLRGDRTIVLTTHSIEQGLPLADRMVILVDGAVAYEGREGLDDWRAVGQLYTQVVRSGAWVH